MTHEGNPYEFIPVNEEDYKQVTRLAGTVHEQRLVEALDLRQTRMESLAEALINCAVGFGVNFTANMIVLPAFGFTSLSLGTNVLIGIVYTVISVVRQYAIRRWAQDKMRSAKATLAATLTRYFN